MDALKGFDHKHAISASNGKLSSILTVTRRLIEEGLPLPVEALTTKGRGQIAGTGGSAVKKILAEHGITRRLSSEGGRTSRGTIGRSMAYVELMNSLCSCGALGKGKKDIRSSLKMVESYWVDRVREYLNRQKIKVRLDLALSVGQIVTEALKEARKRQSEIPGSTIEGTVLQHLVGAKLTLVMGKDEVRDHPSSAADEQTDRVGDFQIGDTVIHVTTAPAEAVVEKSKRNLDASLRPLIICPSDKVAAAKQLAANSGLEERIEVLSAEGFISTNLNELSRFEAGRLRETAKAFIEQYNEIIARHESDLSLQIEEAR
jgi:hypothetical protein